MITHENIKNLVTEWSLQEHIIEKDYVLGWVLWGIGANPDIGTKWIFKGGTCIKKCYIETYRFSEDLDFTVLPDGPIKPDDIRPIINKILKKVEEESGINLSIAESKFKETAQAIYKQWFVDFEFPDENGNPYKSTGGEMVYNEELDKEIPKEWKGCKYKNVIEIITGKLNSNAAMQDGKYPFFTCSNETFKTNTYSFNTEAVLLAGNNDSATYPLKYFSGKFDVYQRTYVITAKSSNLSNKQIFFSIMDELEKFKGVSSGTVTKFLTMAILNDLKIVIADEKSGKIFKRLIDPFFAQKLIIEKKLEQLKKIADLILKRLTLIFKNHSGIKTSTNNNRLRYN